MTVTLDQIAELIPKYRGNLAAVGRALGVTRTAIWKRVQTSATLKQLLLDERESFKDNAETTLQTKVLAGDTTALIFFLKTQARDRGYIEESKTTGDLTITVRREKSGNHFTGTTPGARAGHRRGETIQRAYDGETVG